MIILFPQGAFSGDNEAHFKGAVSRNLSKYTIVEIATKTERNKKISAQNTKRRYNTVNTKARTDGQT